MFSYAFAGFRHPCSGLFCLGVPLLAIVAHIAGLFCLATPLRAIVALVLGSFAWVCLCGLLLPLLVGVIDWVRWWRAFLSLFFAFLGAVHSNGICLDPRL
ncbi:MAG: hypothetical protein K8963_06425 [Proteobacteria bacterium]|nr:hypothetical protein [Pseudomonadota bacterium]